MNADVRTTNTEVVLQRIYNEFLEMPGLCVTCQQAQRLWGLDRETCFDVLQLLVDAKFLCRNGRGMYARLTEGHAECPRPYGTHWR